MDISTTSSATTTSGTRSDSRPERGAKRIGGIAALLVPAACTVAVYSTAVAGPNLRQGAFPWAVSAGCVLAAMTVAALVRRHHQVWGRGGRTVARATTGGVVGVAVFFVVLGGEDLLNRTLGTARVLSDSDLLTGLGTLAASLLTIVVVPLGLLLVGYFTARAAVLARPGRVAMLAVGPVLVLRAVLTGLTETLWISATWPLLLGVCWAVVGTTLLREGSSR
jgi:hypothetical protein